MPASLSGQFQQQGRQALAGLRAWAEDVNRAGGGIRLDDWEKRVAVEVVHYDDGSLVEGARAVTERLLVQDRVDLLMGPYSSVLAKAAVQVSEEHGQVMWNQGGASEDIYRQGYAGVVGILTPPSRYLAGLPEVFHPVCPETRRLAVVRAATGEFPAAVSSGVRQRAEELGFETVLELEYDPASPDYDAIVQALQRVGPDMLIGAGRIRNDLELARRLASSGLSLGAVALVAAGIQRFRDELGGRAEGFIGPSQWEPEGRHRVDYGPTAEAVLDSLRRQSKDPVDYPMVQSYAAGLIAQRCVESAGSLGPVALRRAAGDLDFSTFYGRFRIDPVTGRQVGRSVALVQWQRGRKVIIWPPEQALGELAYPWSDGPGGWGTGFKPAPTG